MWDHHSSPIILRWFIFLPSLWSQSRRHRTYTDKGEGSGVPKLAHAGSWKPVVTFSGILWAACHPLGTLKPAAVTVFTAESLRAATDFLHQSFFPLESRLLNICQHITGRRGMELLWPQWWGATCTVSGKNVKHRLPFWGENGIFLWSKLISFSAYWFLYLQSFGSRKEQVFLDECFQFLVITSISPILQKDLFSDKGRKSLFSLSAENNIFT